MAESPGGCRMCLGHPVRRCWRLASDKPPQQCTQGHDGRDEPYHPHASRKSDLVLRLVFLYPGLPNPFVEIWIFICLQHRSFINSFWYILSTIAFDVTPNFT